ncbi:hypothetical protein HYZ97_03130 [Candidatus Pacearchaeota archaeon]|nr:hypothetical protein [Candidatus Pacearchaeota archaeon]
MNNQLYHPVNDDHARPYQTEPSAEEKTRVHTHEPSPLHEDGFARERDGWYTHPLNE